MTTVQETKMLERKLAALRAHRNNIRRYRRLLGTNLTDIERAFISKRIEEEEQALQSLSENDAHLLPATRIAPLHVGGAGYV